MRRVIIAATLAFIGLASTAQAHPKLLSASPLPNETVTRPAELTLRFSEKLIPKVSGAGLMMTAHGGTTHPPIKLTGTTAVGADGRSLLITPTSPLAPGSYNLVWHVVSIDTHRVAGTYAFAVK